MSTFARVNTYFRDNLNLHISNYGVSQQKLRTTYPCGSVDTHLFLKVMYIVFVYKK